MNQPSTEPDRYCYHFASSKLPGTIGSKAANLRLLQQKKFPIPNTYVCTWDAFLDYYERGEPVLHKLRRELEAFIDPARMYAVRSSANIEDNIAHSFAGQFTSYLNCCGVDGVLEAVQAVWRDSQTESVHTYIEKKVMADCSLKMAVVIQEMVQPVIAGVAFSKNPITTFDEVVVEGVCGSGEQLVQEGITPMRWINKWGKWVDIPDNSPVPLAVIEQVKNGTRKIARTFDREVDLEWVYDGKQLYWLQMRDITSIKEIDLYSNRMSKEMSPGMLQPLVWSVVVPVMSRVWTRILSDVIGENKIDPTKLMRAFHYRSYINMGVFGRIFEGLGMPRESLEMMLGMVPPGAGKPPMKMHPKNILLVPRVIRFIFDKWTFASRLEANYPSLYADAKSYSLAPAAELSEVELLGLIDRLVKLNDSTAYDTVVAILIMQSYNGLLRGQLSGIGVDPHTFDLTAGMESFREYDLIWFLNQLNSDFNSLPAADAEMVRQEKYAGLQQLSSPQGEGFKQGVDDFIARFGHMSETTGHFASQPWRDTPDFVVDLIINYTHLSAGESRKTRFEDLPIRGLKRAHFRLMYNRARQFRLYRERFSSLYTYTIQLFRVYYLALGHCFMQRGVLEACEDILFLYDEEIRACVSGQLSGEDFAALAAQRKQEMEDCKDAVMPEVIFGDQPPPIIPKVADKLNGIATSRGYYTGKVKVIRGLHDFKILDKGDVLVIPFSDVSWAPLFALAGAVVAESGGILSHSSIIAREYNMPAVVSVAGALQLQNDTLVTIDGYKGEVLIHTNIGNGKDVK